MNRKYIYATSSLTQEMYRRNSNFIYIIDEILSRNHCSLAIISNYCLLYISRLYYNSLDFLDIPATLEQEREQKEPLFAKLFSRRTLFDHEICFFSFYSMIDVLLTIQQGRPALPPSVKANDTHVLIS